MNQEDKKKDAFTHFGKEASVYHEQYVNPNEYEKYPADRFRLNIFLSLLQEISPKSVLDVGCGSGQPLLEVLEAGFNAQGLEFSPEMVSHAKKRLEEAGQDPQRVIHGNMEKTSEHVQSLYDCVTAMGSVYYARDFAQTMKEVSSVVKENGDFIFSLRNKLFSLFSMNQYTIDFLINDMLPFKELSSECQKEVSQHLMDKCLTGELREKFKTVDACNIHSIFHNPLTIGQEIKAYGLELVDLYYYHYHALPPVFEHSFTQEFREQSAKLEKAQDWRGMFLCSTFIVHARKKS